MTVAQYETSRGEKRWEVRYRKPDGASSRKRGFMRRKDAAAWEASHVITAKARGEFIDPTAGDITVGELWERYWAAQVGVWRPSTARPMESAWRLHVAPQWAGRRVNSLLRSEVQAWVSDLTASGLSPTLVLRCFGVLKGCVQLAERDGLIGRAACLEHIRLPRKAARKDERHYLTPAQLLAVADAAGAHGALVLVLGVAGLRWGEAAGLRVRDVDVEARVLHVRRTLTKVGRDWVDGRPKSWEARDVPVPAFLMDRLAGELPDDQDGRVFTGADGGPIRQQSVSSPSWGWWAAALSRCGLEPMPCHDLRHTAASIAVSAGANVKVLQRMLGHKSAAMTLDTYADLFDEDLARVADRVDERFAECGRETGRVQNVSKLSESEK